MQEFLLLNTPMLAPYQEVWKERQICCKADYKGAEERALFLFLWTLPQKPLLTKCGWLVRMPILGTWEGVVGGSIVSTQERWERSRTFLLPFRPPLRKGTNVYLYQKMKCRMFLYVLLFSLLL